MASSDVDQKYLGRLAKQASVSTPLLSSALFQILGLSVLLSKRLFRARKLRKLDTSRDTKSLALYHHIIWLSREGLAILETYVFPYMQGERQSPELRVLSAKLRSSFYHIFCLFHNYPPVSQYSIPVVSNPIPVRGDNSQAERPSVSQNTRAKTERSQRVPNLRETIPSMTSEASYITNPYATGGPVGTPSPAPPPGLPPGLAPLNVPHRSAFLLPPFNFLPPTSAYFLDSTTLATTLLSGSHPLRLSAQLEHAMFLWDCLHEHEAARQVARKAIRDCHHAGEGLSDADFEDAAQQVSVLGKVMRRKSWEGTPKVEAAGSPPASGGSATAAARGAAAHALGSSTSGVAGASTPLPRRSSAKSGTRRGRGDPGTASGLVEERGPVGTPGRERRRAGSDERSQKHGSGDSKKSGIKDTPPRAGSNRSSGGNKSSGSSKETTPRGGTTKSSSGSAGSSTPRAARRDAQGGTPRTQDTPTRIR